MYIALKHERRLFDSEGNPLKGKLETKNADGSTTEYQFEYDAKGNPILTGSYTMYTPERLIIN